MTDDDRDYGAYALDLPQNPILSGDYLSKTGDLKEKRGLYWDEQCRSIADEVTEEWNLGLSRFNRLSMKVLNYLWENDKEMLNNIMEEMWDDI